MCFPNDIEAMLIQRRLSPSSSSVLEFNLLRLKNVPPSGKRASSLRTNGKYSNLVSSMILLDIKD